MRSKAFLVLLLSVCMFLPALAQTKPATSPQVEKAKDDQDDVVRITTNLVQIDVVVTKNGKPVPNLTLKDFEIFEDGRRQAITNFAYISNVPDTTPPPVSSPPEKTRDAPPFTPLKRDDPRRTLAIVVDDLGLSAESIHHVKRQLRKFIEEEFQPNDLVAIMRTSGELGALQQFTNDRRLLNRAVDQLRWNFCSRVGINVFPPLAPAPFHYLQDKNHCGGGAYGQTLRALRFILDAMGQLPGRKSLVFMSDSAPLETQEIELSDEGYKSVASGSVNYSDVLQKIAEKAIRSSVVIYSVDTQGLPYTGLTAADKIVASGSTMTRAISDTISLRSNLFLNRREGGNLIAKQTGGFQVRNSNSFQFDRIMEDQSGYYLLGYRPTDETFNKRFHQIRVRVKRSGMNVRTRYGFFGVSEEEASRNRLSPRDQTNLALASPFSAQDVEVNMTSFFANPTSQGSVIRSFVYLATKDLTFTPVDGRHEGAIELHGVAFGDNGSVVEQLSRSATLKLSAGDYEYAVRNGIALTFDMPVKAPGFYQVRVAVRDRNSSRLGSAGEFVAVPDLSRKRPALSGIVLGTAPTRDDPDQGIANPGLRRFDANSNLHFVYVIYNAKSGGASQRKLSMETRLFRDGKNVYSGPEVLIEDANQPDPDHVLVNGVLPLDAQLDAGSYYLQIMIRDKVAKNKLTPLVQWVDFEIATHLRR